MTVLVFGCADLPLIHYLSGMRGTPQKDREQCLLFSLSLFLLLVFILGERLELEPRPETTVLSLVISHTWQNLASKVIHFFLSLLSLFKVILVRWEVAGLA